MKSFVRRVRLFHKIIGKVSMVLFFIMVGRYGERNALHAGLIERTEQWRWGSAWQRVGGVSPIPLSPGP